MTRFDFEELLESLEDSPASVMPGCVLLGPETLKLMLERLGREHFYLWLRHTAFYVSVEGGDFINDFKDSYENG